MSLTTTSAPGKRTDPFCVVTWPWTMPTPTLGVCAAAKTGETRHSRKARKDFVNESAPLSGGGTVIVSDAAEADRDPGSHSQERSPCNIHDVVISADHTGDADADGEKPEHRAGKGQGRGNGERDRKRSGDVPARERGCTSREVLHHLRCRVVNGRIGEHRLRLERPGRSRRSRCSPIRPFTTRRRKWCRARKSTRLNSSH